MLEVSCHEEFVVPPHWVDLGELVQDASGHSQTAPEDLDVALAATPLFAEAQVLHEKFHGMLMQGFCTIAKCLDRDVHVLQQLVVGDFAKPCLDSIRARVCCALHGEDPVSQTAEQVLCTSHGPVLAVVHPAPCAKVPTERLAQQAIEEVDGCDDAVVALLPTEGHEFAASCEALPCSLAMTQTHCSIDQHCSLHAAIGTEHLHQGDLQQELMAKAGIPQHQLTNLAGDPRHDVRAPAIAHVAEQHWLAPRRCQHLALPPSKLLCAGFRQQVQQPIIGRTGVHLFRGLGQAEDVLHELLWLHQTSRKSMRYMDVGPKLLRREGWLAL